jgi:hypothetical protein
MTSCWIGVASRDHVRDAVGAGICQLGHGKEAPVRRLERGDILVYYSPRERMQAGAPVQAFTAAGRILDEAPYQADAGHGFKPWRRKIEFFPVTEAPIEPLLTALSFTRGQDRWGMVFRRNAFEITPEDYRHIAHALGIDQR